MATYSTVDAPASEGGGVGVAFPSTDDTAGGAPAPTVYYINQAWDDVAVAYVTWISTGAYDTGGAAYPGPGVWGVNTSFQVGKGYY